MSDPSPADSPFWIEIFSAPLPVQRATAFVSADSCGAICTFLGTTRAQQLDNGRALTALDYEAYQPMAERELIRLAQQAGINLNARRIAILHRIGRVAVGEPSVVIAVSTPHRAESFTACQWLIDELKKSVPIWKHDV